MSIRYRAAVLRAANSPMQIEQVEAEKLGPRDVLVKIRAAGLCHTDLEVMDGSLRLPMPIVLGHEAAGTIEALGTEVRDTKVGDKVVLSWNPSCGHCFYCDRALPILCEQYLEEGPNAFAFDGVPRAHVGATEGTPLHQLMFLGAFGEYCIVTEQQAIPVPEEIPFEQASLIGCGVMTGVGAALNIAEIGVNDTVMVLGCGAVGLSAIQGARLAGARNVIAVDLEPAKLDLARRIGATHTVNARDGDPSEIARELTDNRGADVVLESAGNPAAFRTSAEAVRPGGQIVWLGKVDVQSDVAFRWGALMGEKRIRRSSYGGARPRRDFPALASAYLEGDLKLDELITQRISLEEINEGFDALRAGTAIRSVITFPA